MSGSGTGAERVDLQMRIVAMLRQHGVSYCMLGARGGFEGCQQLASATRVRCVPAFIHNRVNLVVIPVGRDVDWESIRRATGDRAACAVPSECAALLIPEGELAELPPFGNLWNVPVVIGACTPSSYLLCPSGHRDDLVCLSYADFCDVCTPYQLPVPISVTSTSGARQLLPGDGRRAPERVRSAAQANASTLVVHAIPSDGVMGERCARVQSRAAVALLPG